MYQYAFLDVDEMFSEEQEMMMTMHIRVSKTRKSDENIRKITFAQSTSSSSVDKLGKNKR